MSNWSPHAASSLLQGDARSREDAVVSVDKSASRYFSGRLGLENTTVLGCWSNEQPCLAFFWFASKGFGLPDGTSSRVLGFDKRKELGALAIPNNFLRLVPLSWWISAVPSKFFQRQVSPGSLALAPGSWKLLPGFWSDSDLPDLTLSPRFWGVFAGLGAGVMTGMWALESSSESEAQGSKGACSGMLPLRKGWMPMTGNWFCPAYLLVFELAPITKLIQRDSTTCQHKRGQLYIYIYILYLYNIYIMTMHDLAWPCGFGSCNSATPRTWSSRIPPFHRCWRGADAVHLVQHLPTGYLLPLP